MNRANYSIEEDSFGKFLKVKMEVSLYPLTSILKSTYWFTDRCFLYIQWADQAHETLYIMFRGKEELEEQALHAIAGDFLNSVLDQTIRAQVEEETTIVKSVIVKRAFSEALSKQEQQFVANM